LLRCTDSIKIFKELAQRKPQPITLVVAGSVDPLPKSFQRILTALPGVQLFGRYDQSDLSRIYASGQLAWCCDWALGLNSCALLPNRLYHAIEFGKPIIASRGSWTARVVECYDLGISIPNDPEAAAIALAAISIDDYHRYQENLRSVRAKLGEVGSGWRAVFSGKPVRIDSAILSGRVFG
jgi:glycosyltransferase involved in cell wall biosynthesis